MSVRGSKNKIIIYIAGACTIAFAILLYHNASQRLEALEISYERCHLNEESLSAQLQVNLEYKIRLEKSLQQEKSDHAQTKEDLQGKLEDERQRRGRENLEASNKISALQQQYKLLQNQHGVVTAECNKLRQLQLAETEDKKQLEELIQNFKKDLNILKANNTRLEEENLSLLAKNKKIEEKLEELEKSNEKIKTNPSVVKLPDQIPLNPLFVKNTGNQSEYQHMRILPKGGVSQAIIMTKSSTQANKFDRGFYPSANSLFANISTPMINPQAVQDDDKIPIAPMPQPRQESSSMKDNNGYYKNENVGPKPEEMERKNINGMASVQGFLRAPDIFNQFEHVPEIHNYKKQQLREVEKNNNGGEVGDEGEPLVRNALAGGEFHQQPLVGHPMANVIPRNAAYQYAAEEEGRKGEEDDDDLDPLDYHNANDKNNDGRENDLKQIQIQMPFADKHDNILLHQK